MTRRLCTGMLGVLVVLWAPAMSHGEGLGRSGSIGIALNPVKYAYGLPNLEIEYFASSEVSIYVSGEGLLFEYMIKRTSHPDLVAEIGPRYHLPIGRGGEWAANVSGSLGYTWSANTPSFVGWKLNGIVGVRYLFASPLFVGAKGIVTLGLANGGVLPGAEAQIGVIP